MHSSVRSLCALVAAAASVALASVSAKADITGFGDYTTDWRYQSLDAGAPLSVSGNGIRLTAIGGGEQYRNYFNVNTQGVSQFVASFTYQATPDTTANASRSGLVFTLFTSPHGTDGTTVSGGSSGEFGYTGGSATQNPLNPSVALILQDPDSSGRVSGAGFYTNHNIGGDVPATGSVNLGANHPISVILRYNQAGDLANFLYLTLTDTTTGDTFTPSPFLLNVPLSLGASNAYVGFTTHGGNNDQFVNDFRFANIPAPSALFGVVGGALVCSRRTRSGRATASA